MVDPVAEPRNLLLLCQQPRYILDRVHIFLIDGEKHAHYRLICAPMERTLEGADSAGNGGVNVRQGGRDDPGGEGGGIQLMVGMKDKRHVERLGGGRRRLFPFNIHRKLAAWLRDRSASTTGLPLRRRSYVATSMAI